ncbi:MAG: hypothetical protein WED10_14570, partial [Brumimicrobium sp.]
MKEQFKDGLYDEILSLKKEKSIKEAGLESYLEDLDPAEFPEYVSVFIERILKIVIENIKEGDRIEKGLKLCNSLIKILNTFSENNDSTNFASDKLLQS